MDSQPPILPPAPPQPTIPVAPVPPPTDMPWDPNPKPIKNKLMNVPLWRWCIGVVTAALVSYGVFLLVIAVTNDLGALFTGPAAGILVGALILYFISKISIFSSIFVPITSIYLYIAFSAIGFPANENQAASYVLPVTTIVVSYFVCALLFSFVRRVKYLEYILPVVLIMVFSSLRFTIFMHNATNETKESLNNVTFQLFQPNYAPADFSLSYVKAESDPGWSFALPNVKLKFRAKNTEDRGSYELTEFAHRKNFNPPESCGPSDPLVQDDDSFPTPCISLGKAKSGCEVYREEYFISDYNKQQKVFDGISKEELAQRFHTAAYCELDGTIISMGILPTLTNAEVVKVYDSLIPVEPAQLYKYIQQ